MDSEDNRSLNFWFMAPVWEKAKGLSYHSRVIGSIHDRKMGK